MFQSMAADRDDALLHLAFALLGAAGDALVVVNVLQQNHTIAIFFIAESS